MPKSKSDQWQTPPEIYSALHKEFDFCYDPCPIDWNPEIDEDGLDAEWGSRTFCNPPYSQVAKFIKKAHEEWRKGKLIVMLINVITDTRAFHEYIYNQAELRFIAKRVSFINSANPEKRSPNVRPSMIVVFR